MSHIIRTLCRMLPYVIRPETTPKIYWNWRYFERVVTHADGVILVCTDWEPSPVTAAHAMQNVFDSGDVDASFLTNIEHHIFSSINQKVIVHKTRATSLIILTTYFTTTMHLKDCLSLKEKISDDKKELLKGFQNYALYVIVNS